MKDKIILDSKALQEQLARCVNTHDYEPVLQSAFIMLNSHPYNTHLKTFIAKRLLPGIPRESIACSPIFDAAKKQLSASRLPEQHKERNASFYWAIACYYRLGDFDKIIAQYTALDEQYKNQQIDRSTHQILTTACALEKREDIADTLSKRKNFDEYDGIQSAVVSVCCNNPANARAYILQIMEDVRTKLNASEMGKCKFEKVMLRLREFGAAGIAVKEYQDLLKLGEEKGLLHDKHRSLSLTRAVLNPMHLKEKFLEKMELGEPVFGFERC